MFWCTECMFLTWRSYCAEKFCEHAHSPAVGGDSFIHEWAKKWYRCLLKLLFELSNCGPSINTEYLCLSLAPSFTSSLHLPTRGCLNKRKINSCSSSLPTAACLNPHLFSHSHFSSPVFFLFLEVERSSDAHARQMFCALLFCVFLRQEGVEGSSEGAFLVRHKENKELD